MPPAPDFSLLPSLPGYEVDGVLGRGGHAIVYHARDCKLDRPVAVKMIAGSGRAQSESLRRFLAEARVLARLQHPNIVAIHDVEEWGGAPFLVLEYCGGGSLEERLQSRRHAPHEAAELVLTMARAVQHAHEHGVVHRDLKPSNVLFTQEGVLKVTDFSVAKLLDPGGQQTIDGVLLGSPSYMAPEQAEGNNHRVGPVTDVYALGAILYELLTGRPACTGSSIPAVLRQVCDGTIEKPRALCSDIPPSLEAIVMRCLEKKPEDRYPAAQALAQELERFLTSSTPATCSLWRRLLPSPHATAVVGALVLFLLALLFWPRAIAHPASPNIAGSRAGSGVCSAWLEGEESSPIPDLGPN
jgi:serine/threonine protein kinase